MPILSGPKINYKKKRVKKEEKVKQSKIKLNGKIKTK